MLISVQKEVDIDVKNIASNLFMNLYYSLKVVKPEEIDVEYCKDYILSHIYKFYNISIEGSDLLVLWQEVEDALYDLYDEHDKNEHDKNEHNKMGKILISRIQTPDGTILTSRYTHDFQSYVDKNGETYILDGGCEYQRVSLNKIPAKDISIYENSPFEEIRKIWTWGTFNTDGERIWVTLDKLTSPHIINIIKYNEDNGHGNGIANKLFVKELNYRNENHIFIPDNEKLGGYKL